MGERTAAGFDVSIGDVYAGGQVIVGDHTTVQTTAGTKVTVLQVDERPRPRLRPRPVDRRPRAVAILGRADELELVAAVAAEAPVQLYGPDGVGKTAVLKLAAARAAPAAGGVVFEPMRHRSLDEVQSGLYAAFWECEVPFTPAPVEFEEYLGELEALLVLDDCGLGRDELATLLDRLPRCAVALAAEQRTLWSRGQARALGDLDLDAAIGLLERELGHPLDADEREAAEAVVARIGGNPQSLVETAALIEDGRSSLVELGRDPDGLARRFDPAALSDSQQRVLGVLSALDRSALGTEHVAALAGVADAGEDLRDLERRGWVKAGSPRYRAVRSVPPGIGVSREEVARALLPQLTRWAAKSSPGAVAAEAEGIEGALRLGTERERWEEVLALSLAAQRELFVSAAWSSCRRVLRSGLDAARMLDDKPAAGYLLHQLGSQSLCLGERAEAEAELTEALRTRERLGDEKGAELTRHNLRQLWGEGGDGGSHGGEGGDGGPGLPRVPIALGIVAVVIALVIGAIALAGGGGEETAKSHSGKGTHGGPDGDGGGGSGGGKDGGSSGGGTPAGTPTIEIANPEDGATFKEEEELGEEETSAIFTCVPAEGGEIESCEGAIDGGSVEDLGALVMDPGEHVLVVDAIEGGEVTATRSVTYTVVEGEPPPPEPEPETDEPEEPEPEPEEQEEKEPVVN